jgi:hypothetical protein
MIFGAVVHRSDSGWEFPSITGSGGCSLLTQLGPPKRQPSTPLDASGASREPL